jgi:N-acetylglucosamine kinase-like BadF-type ATPase
MAGIAASELAGAGFGVSGFDWPSDLPGHAESIAALGLGCPFEVVNDAINGLLAGASQGWGVSVTAGSSVNVRGRDQHGREGRIVGNGAYFGEFGGAVEIVMKALQQVNYAWMQRKPPTALTGVLLQAAGAIDEMDLMEGLSNKRYTLPASLAIEIFKAANQGDAAAREVITWAGEEMGWLAIAVTRQLELQDAQVEVVLSGKIFEGGAMIRDALQGIVLQHAPQARLLRLEAPPVVGAVVLGMHCAGLPGFEALGSLSRCAQQLFFQDA